MTTFQTTTYYNYSDAYNDITTQIKGSTVLNSQQIADCLEALATIASPSPTGTASNTPVTSPGTGQYTPVQPVNTNLA